MGWLGGEELTGRILGGCELRQHLGSGAMSAVFLGFQTNLGREVAVKVLPQSIASVSGYGARFSKEAKILGLLEHPNIVPIYDYGIDDGISYIIMRLMPGGSLSPRLNGGPLPVDATLTLIHELADALDYAHNRGVVHRDIKASNVLFDQRGRGHLADFGIAKLLDAAETQTTPTNQFGTPAYMAPELWRDEEPSPSADIYALGVLTYYALCNVLPFEASSPYALMVMHLTKHHTPIRELDPSIPTAVDSVLSRSLDKDPRQRFASSRDFADALETAFGAKDVPLSRSRTKQFPNKNPNSAVSTEDMTLALQSETKPLQDSRQPSRTSSSRMMRFAAAAAIMGLGLFAAISNRPPDGETGLSVGSTPTIDAATVVAVNAPASDTPTPSGTPSLTASPSTTQTPSATPSATLTMTHTPTSSATLTMTSSPTSTVTVAPTSTATITASKTHTPTQEPTDTAVATEISTAISVTPSNSGIPALIRLTGSLTAARQSAVVSQKWMQGEIVDICLRSRDFDAKLWLADTEGTELVMNDDYGGGIDACIMQYSVAATGTYLITAGSYDVGATGDYELVVTSYAACGRMPIAMIVVSEANLRLAPNSTSQIIAGLARDHCYVIEGRTSDSVWWRVTMSDGVSGWLSVATISVVGDTNSVPISLP